MPKPPNKYNPTPRARTPVALPEPEIVPSLYELHVQRWKLWREAQGGEPCNAQGCTRGCGSELCIQARNVCLVRGSLPCDVLFIGEAPGESEDVLGSPFKGPAGHLLDDIVDRSLGDVNYGREREGRGILLHAFTNLVGCIPRDPGASNKAAEPLPEDIRLCMPRLQELVEIANPQMIVCVGSLARDWHDTKVKNHHTYHRPTWWVGDPMRAEPAHAIRVIDIIHPAAILRMNLAQQGLARQRCTVALSNALEDLP